MALSSSERTLTLAEFCASTGIYTKAQPPYNGYCYTIHDSQVLREDRWALHHLKDYVVSSITAGTIWLVERDSNA